MKRKKKKRDRPRIPTPLFSVGEFAKRQTRRSECLLGKRKSGTAVGDGPAVFVNGGTRGVCR